MAHFTAGLGIFFPIDMDKYILDLEYLIQALINSFTGMPFFTQQVHNSCREYMVRAAQRIFQHYSPEHIELAAVIGLDAVMTTVMNPGSGFIYQHIVIIVNK